MGGGGWVSEVLWGGRGRSVKYCGGEGGVQCMWEGWAHTHTHTHTHTQVPLTSTLVLVSATNCGRANDLGSSVPISSGVLTTPTLSDDRGPLALNGVPGVVVLGVARETSPPPAVRILMDLRYTPSEKV